MFKRITFGSKVMNKSLQCYEVGVLGCISIIENNYGKDDSGLEACDYTVAFENGKSITINDTMIVSD